MCYCIACSELYMYPYKVHIVITNIVNCELAIYTGIYTKFTYTNVSLPVAM